MGDDLTDNTLVPMALRAKEGEGEALERLIELLLPRVTIGVRNSPLCSHEDQQQIARVAIWEAVNTYVPGAGATFKSWALNTASPTR